MEKIKRHIIEVLEQAFVTCDLSKPSAGQLESSLSYPDISFGDLASSVAMQKASELKRSPLELANTLREQIKVDEIIGSVAVKAPGFINITLQPTVWRDFVNQLGPDFIKSDRGQNESVNLEFVSANPTGPLVLVNAWAGYFGDILGNILTSQGFAVMREYYVNNIGLQIENLGKSVQAVLGKEFSNQERADFYPGGYIEKVAAKLVGRYGQPERVCQQPAAEIGSRAAEVMLELFIKPSLKHLEVDFDHFFAESSLDNEATLERLENAGAIKKHDGAIWLDGEKVGIEKDEVLVRRNGIGTYFLSDISYQLDKLEQRKFGRAVAIFGADHHGHSKRLKKTLQFLGYDGLEVLTVQMVRLIKDGQEVKMSKRAGNFVEVERLFDEVPSPVARFFFASHDISTHMSFDLDIVAERTRNNPFFYTNYAYARSHSILKKASEEGLSPVAKITHDLSQKEIELLKKITELKQIAVEITINYRVHNLIHAFVDLAKIFHEYYESERIIQLPRDEASSKLAFVTKYIDFCDQVFGLIGVTPSERM